MNLFIWKLKNAAFRLTSPRFWVVNKPVNWQYDAIIREALDSGKEVEVSDLHMAKIGGLAIWISNYPYAFATPYMTGPFMPSPITRRRIWKQVCESKVRETRDILKTVRDEVFS